MLNLAWFSISVYFRVDKLPQVSVQVFEHSVLVLNRLENSLHHVWAVTVAMWRVRTCTNKHITPITTTADYHLILLTSWTHYMTFKVVRLLYGSHYTTLFCKWEFWSHCGLHSTWLHVYLLSQLRFVIKTLHWLAVKNEEKEKNTGERIDQDMQAVKILQRVGGK